MHTLFSITINELQFQFTFGSEIAINTDSSVTSNMYTCSTQIALLFSYVYLAITSVLHWFN